MTEQKGRIYNAFNLVKKGTLFISGLAVFLMMAFIATEVILRNIFSASISGNYEILENYFMPISVFPVIAITYASGLMPKITMVVDRLSANKQLIIDTILLMIEMLIMVLLFYITLNYAIDGAIDQIGFPAGGIMFPLYPVLFLVPLGFALLIIEIVFTIIHKFKEK